VTLPAVAGLGGVPPGPVGVEPAPARVDPHAGHVVVERRVRGPEWVHHPGRAHGVVKQRALGQRDQHHCRPRVRLHCRFVGPRIQIIPDFRRDSVPLFLKRQCDRTLRRPRGQPRIEVVERPIHGSAEDGGGGHRASARVAVADIVTDERMKHQGGVICPGRKPPLLVVDHPVHQYKSAIAK
jgi:hypothetical protein